MREIDAVIEEHGGWPGAFETEGSQEFGRWYRLPARR